MLPNGWKRKSIEDIALVSSGGTPSRSNPAYWGGDIPWVTTAEVDYCAILNSTEKITDLGLKESSAKLYPPETILMAMYGQGKTRGKVAKLGIEAATNQACAAIQLKDGYSPDFYFQYLQSQYKNIRELSNSGGQENLSAGIVKSLLVPVPRIAEQLAIARILAAWDRAISTTEKSLANSQKQRKALAQQLLISRKRIAGFQNKWREVRLGEIFRRVSTRNSGASTNVVTISAKHGLIRQEEFFKKSVASHKLDDYFLLKKGQFAYNKSYSNGYPMGAIKRLNRYSEGVVTTLYICFEVSNPNRNDPVYFEQFFEFGLLNSGLSKVANEGGRAHGLLNVKPSDFFNIKVLCPDIEEQKKIAIIFGRLEKEVQILQRKRDLLRQEKKAIMQQLLAGKLRLRASMKIATTSNSMAVVSVN